MQNLQYIIIIANRISQRDLLLMIKLKAIDLIINNQKILFLLRIITIFALTLIKKIEILIYILIIQPKHLPYQD